MVLQFKALLANIRQGDKRSNLFAHFVSNAEKCFITLTTGLIVTKLFSSSLTKWPNKLKCLPLASLSSLVYFIPGACLKREVLHWGGGGGALTILENIRRGWKGLLMRSSRAHLSSTSLIKKKSFSNIHTRSKCYYRFFFITDDQAK
jgi:hypothetical protein